VVETFADRPYAAQRFQEIVNHAREHNPFYRRWITDPDYPPLLDRMTALEHNDEILNGNDSTGTTSGSISVPFRFSHSRKWTQRTARDVQRFIKSIGGRVPCVRIVHMAPETRDPMTLPVVAPLDEQISFILRHRAESRAIAVTTLPTNAELLSLEIIERGIDMSFVQRFGTYAETLQDHQKKAIMQAFPNARLWQTYSSMEFGMIAVPCPYEPEFFHIMAHRLGLEVLTDDDLPARDGEPGRVYVTDYFNHRSPLIRYELGDLVVRDRCPCDKIRLPALSRILGRVSGTLLNRNGKRVLFVDIAIALREIPGVRQFQVVQDGIEEFTIKVSAQRNIDQEIAEIFRKHLGYWPQLATIEYVETIPRAANGKYRTSICNV
jgi:phenylacetate-coenzyme A ligase PaaK-like adenylate-forming protein